MTRPNKYAGCAAHSAEHFGPARDYWWNDDFLELALRRWGVGKVSSVLDVGCGVGHWGRAWARVLPPEAHLAGIDREPVWVEQASAEALRAGLDSRSRYLPACAEALPFPDDSFDFVTCQTLLIHVSDVPAVLSEMVRVTRPGGLVVAAEPNNAVLPVVEDGLAVGLSSGELARLASFHLVCLRGKARLGQGDETVGRLLSAQLSELGLAGVSVCLNEKTCPLAPPYATTRERAVIEDLERWAKGDVWVWNKAEARRYFLAGGGLETEFETIWADGTALGRRVLEAIHRGTYVSAGGSLFYLAAGRKTSQASQA